MHYQGTELALCHVALSSNLVAGAWPTPPPFALCFAQPTGWRFRFLVALPSVRDLFLCAEHLFFAATVTSGGHKTMTGAVVSCRSMIFSVATSPASQSSALCSAFSCSGRHGCSAARNSPACKGKSLRCLRKCRFAYIDNSPALSARHHLTAALWG